MTEHRPKDNIGSSNFQPGRLPLNLSPSHCHGVEGWLESSHGDSLYVSLGLTPEHRGSGSLSTYLAEVDSHCKLARQPLFLLIIIQTTLNTTSGGLTGAMCQPTERSFSLKSDGWWSNVSFSEPQQHSLSPPWCPPDWCAMGAGPRWHWQAKSSRRASLT